MAQYITFNENKRLSEHQFMNIISGVYILCVLKENFVFEIKVVLREMTKHLQLQVKLEAYKL